MAHGDIEVKTKLSTESKPIIDWVTDLDEFMNYATAGLFYYNTDDKLIYLNKKHRPVLVKPQPMAYLPTMNFESGTSGNLMGWVSGGNLGQVYGEYPTRYKMLDYGWMDDEAWDDGDQHALIRFDADRNTNKLNLQFDVNPMLHLPTINVEYQAMVYFKTTNNVVFFSQAQPDNGLFSEPFTDFHLFEVNSQVQLGLVPRWSPIIGNLKVGTKNYSTETLWGWVGEGTINGEPSDNDLMMPSMNGWMWSDGGLRSIRRVYVSRKDGKYTLQVRFGGDSGQARTKWGLKLEAFGKSWILKTMNKRGDGLELVISVTDYNIWAGLGKETTIKIGAFNYP